ncbi:hypothetical protein [Paraburkholderia sp. J67]|uniref:hypothetical protein n=1 Tax=Paraburkholderia sp. J67 TaxID=2805435 RepID=UPI002ABEA173|nr:hypothetical protein [Paraburkholderia sp. J67]
MDLAIQSKRFRFIFSRDKSDKTALFRKSLVWMNVGESSAPGCHTRVMAERGGARRFVERALKYFPPVRIVCRANGNAPGSCFG